MSAGSYSQVLLFFTVSQVFFRLVKHDMSFQYIPSPSDWSKRAITIQKNTWRYHPEMLQPRPQPIHIDPLVFPPVDSPVCATWCGFGHCDSDCSRQPSRCPCATARFCLFLLGGRSREKRWILKACAYCACMSHLLGETTCFSFVIYGFDSQYDSGWWFQSLWKICVSWDYFSQCMEKKNHVPNRQPE